MTETPSSSASHSTGPKTPAGKARSAQNARTTGWFARDLRLSETAQPVYAEFESAWREELAPEGLCALEAFSDFVRAA